MTKPQRMPVMEIFGPTIQGEGMVIGRKTMFVRTGGCDYSCSWCDSAFTWDGSRKATMMTAQEVFEELERIGNTDRATLYADGKVQETVWTDRNYDHVTISGGNPALIRGAMDEFIDICHRNGIKVGLETQGSRWQDWFLKVDDLTISPKPPSSGMQTDFEMLDRIVRSLVAHEANFSLKVVIFDEVDLAYADQVYERYSAVLGGVFYVSVGNEDPAEEGDISARLIEKLGWLWERILEEHGRNTWRPLPQLHTLVWANKQGV